MPSDNTFKWTLNKGACSDEIEIVVVNNQPTAYAGSDDETCNGTIQMNANDPSLQNAQVNGHYPENAVARRLIHYLIPILLGIYWNPASISSTLTLDT